MSFDISLVVAGALTGFVVGLTGVGGGALMTPILLLVFGIAPTVAIGTDLWFAAITKMFAVNIHHKRNLIDWGVVKALWLGSLPAALLTVIAIAITPASADLTTFLKTAIAVAIFITAISIFLHKPLQKLGQRFRIGQAEKFKRIQMPLTVLAGAVLGTLVALTSVGAGALGAVFLAYLYPLRLTPPRLIATDIVHAIPLALFAGAGHLMMGQFSFGLLGNLLVGSVPAIILGAMISVRLPHIWLRAALGIVLAVIAIKLWTSV
jgi:uncharacterized membrane protein YfcA